MRSVVYNTIQLQLQLHVFACICNNVIVSIFYLYGGISINLTHLLRLMV